MEVIERIRKCFRMEERVQTVKEALLNIQWKDKCRNRSVRCKGCCPNFVKAVLVIFNLTFLVLGWFLLGFGVWLHIYQDNFYFSALLPDDPHPSSYSSPHTTTATGVAIRSLSAGSSLSSSSSSASMRVNKQGSPSGGLGDLLGVEPGAVLLPPGRKPLYSFSNVPFVLIAVGAFLSGMSFLGCCGACAESVCFLVFYTLTTVFIIVIEILLGSVSSTVMGQMSNRLLSNMQHQVQSDYNITAQRMNVTSPVTSLDKITQAWNVLQIEMDCCGALGPQDYMFSSWFNNTKDSTGIFVPASCCTLRNQDPLSLEVEDENLCQVEAIIVRQNTKQPITQLRTRGCHETVVEWFNGYEHRLMSLLSLIILLQMLNLIFACVLIRWVRKKHTDYSWCENDEFE